MTGRWLLFSLYLMHILDQIHSWDSSIQCWKCEAIIPSKEDIGNFLDNCQAQFDFIEHTLVDCDGKCWKSVDVIDMKRLGNDSRERLKLKEEALSSLRSSRRCFSADELLRAAEMGINTANGCRRIHQDNEKPKDICFCSDQDMCNQVHRLTTNCRIYCSNILFLWIFVLFYE